MGKSPLLSPFTQKEGTGTPEVLSHRATTLHSGCMHPAVRRVTAIAFYKKVMNALGAGLTEWFQSYLCLRALLTHMPSCGLAWREEEVGGVMVAGLGHV